MVATQLKTFTPVGTAISAAWYRLRRIIVRNPAFDVRHYADGEGPELGHLGPGRIRVSIDTVAP